MQLWRCSQQVNSYNNIPVGLYLLFSLHSSCAVCADQGEDEFRLYQATTFEERTQAARFSKESYFPSFPLHIAGCDDWPRDCPADSGNATLMAESSIKRSDWKDWVACIRHFESGIILTNSHFLMAVHCNCDCWHPKICLTKTRVHQHRWQNMILGLIHFPLHYTNSEFNDPISWHWWN